ncbi:hypothetical protein ES703_38655 [subsurface metagenome]
MGTPIKNFLAGFIERDQTLSPAFSDQLYEVPVMGDVGPGKQLKFAAAQTRMSQKADHVPFLGLAHGEDLLIFLVIEHPHLRRVLIEHLDFQAGIRQIVMFGQPAAEAFQGSKMCVGGSVDIFFQNMLDVMFDVSGLEVGGINRGKGDKSLNDHFVMDLCARFVTPIITEPSGGCLREEHPCPPL